MVKLRGLGFTTAASRTDTYPITRASRSRRIVLARYAGNRRLGDALHQGAFCSLQGREQGYRHKHTVKNGPALAGYGAIRHPWFLASRSGRDDPRRDWYVWRAGRRSTEQLVGPVGVGGR